MIQESQLPQVRTESIADRLQPGAGPWASPHPKFISIILLVMIALPWLILQMGIGRFILHLFIMFFAWGIVVMCWNLIMGVSGIYSFGQVALFAVGGWTTGLLSMQFGWSPWASIWLAPVAASIAALIIGLPTLRLRGTYVVLLTLAFHELFRNFVTTGPPIISGGGYGLRTVPKMGFETWFGGGRDMLLHYYLAFIFFAITAYAIWRILHSPIGVAFRALRDSEVYAVSRGVDPFRFKLFLFAFSAFFTGLAGGFVTHYQGHIAPSVLGFSVLINLLAMIVIGGWGTFWGPIVGTALLIVLPEVLRSVEAYRNLSLGLALTLIAVFAPQGLGPLVARGVKKALRGVRKKRPDKPTPSQPST